MIDDWVRLGWFAFFADQPSFLCPHPRGACVMSLREKQSEFARMVPRLIDKAHELGFEVTLGDAYRDPRADYGSKSSRHKMRLAIDLNLFKDGIYLTETESHLRLGEWWMDQGGIWGGMFGAELDDAGFFIKYGWDGNHYEWPL